VGVYIALLRAVNVGGTGKLPMAELKRLCVALGFANVQTYIASGNVVFHSAEHPAQVKRALEAALLGYAGKPVDVMIRSAQQMQQVLAGNPFKHGAGNRVVAIFLDEAPCGDALSSIKGQKNERLSLGAQEIYVHYGEDMGTSKLQIPTAKCGTARNMNTVAKLAQLAGALEL
jgi:uncharacterized protein (DUF1697 family)